MHNVLILASGIALLFGFLATPKANSPSPPALEESIYSSTLAIVNGGGDIVPFVPIASESYSYNQNGSRNVRFKLDALQSHAPVHVD